MLVFAALFTKVSQHISWSGVTYTKYKGKVKIRSRRWFWQYEK